MPTDEAIEWLADFAASYRDDEIVARRASVTLGVRLDFEPVARVILLLEDPRADTWDLDRIQELRRAVCVCAIQLGLSDVSLSLVPESEADVVDAFAHP